MEDLKWINVKKPIIKKILPLNKSVKEKETKLKKSKIAFLVVCVLFSISLGLNIIMFLNSLDKKISTNLGETITCEITQPDNYVFSIFHPSGIVGGTYINQKLYIKNATSNPQYIRVKATTNLNNSKIHNNSLNVNEEWIYHKDYYYLNYALNINENIEVCNKIAFTNIYTKFKNSVTNFQIECLENLSDALKIWQAPEDWLSWVWVWQFHLLLIPVLSYNLI